MKKNRRRSNRNAHLRIYQPPYPNAAEPRYYLRKALDVLTAIASGLGVCSVLLFFFLLG